MPGRLKVKDKVWVELDHEHEELLDDMGLADDVGNIVHGVRMYGEIQSRSRNYFKVYLPAAEESLQFVCDKTNKVVGAEPPVYFVVVHHEVHGHIIKEVRGLLLPHDVQGYHTTKAQAINELNSGMNDVSKFYLFVYLHMIFVLQLSQLLKL